jgi:aryl-alcohol dehydrogenase-like predicted oxidoreductase
VASDQRRRLLPNLTDKEPMSTNLKTRYLRGLGRPVSAIGAGCWTIGGPATNQGVPIGWDRVDSGRALAGLLHAQELGVTLYDTADVYGLGHSERLLGRLLSRVPRHEVVISSKVGYFASAAHPYTAEQMGRQLVRAGRDRRVRIRRVTRRGRHHQAGTRARCSARHPSP